MLIALSTLSGPGGPLAAAGCWRPPTDAAITDPFREPMCRWCSGNRGIEYATSSGDVVRAVATGRVVFSGTVAGVRYVVVRHRDGLRATYGRLVSARVRTGDPVVRGSMVGRADEAFHFGVRDGSTYLDPAPFLGRFVHRPRLIPSDGGRPNPAPPPVLRCPR